MPKTFLTHRKRSYGTPTRRLPRMFICCFFKQRDYYNKILFKNQENFNNYFSLLKNLKIEKRDFGLESFI